VALGAAGCVEHIAPYKPRHRTFAPGAYAAPATPRGASIWSAGQGGMYEDDRAHRVGDILVVKIDESDQASRDDSTALDRKSSTQLGLPAVGVLGALAAKYPDVDPSQLLGTDSAASFSGGGKIQRKGRLVATLPVRVQQVMPNGDLFVEGTKVVKIGREEQHLYLSGLVRKADVRPDDVVLSSRIAEAEIEITGRGDVTAQQRPGWFTRLITTLNPF
ncbi:MAG: flagellar basal body L-ring protein FlgH, partial [Kofleriaceae bacterium]|nr:flagellar basal body L-ring protein FlgH [Kofleriaceae bacterium]